MLLYRTKLQEKRGEALRAVLPIMGIVLLLSFTIAPIPPSILMVFLIGGALLILGMTLFSLGAELAMTPMGERVGSCMTRSRKLWVMLSLGFLLGFLITISEPDLQVLAEQVPSVPNRTLVLTVACGVGLFLCVALLRMLFSVPLPAMLVGFYIFVFALAFFVPRDFLAVAFDAGGVTTGPMTVPFIMALGVGISAIRSDKHAADDSFCWACSTIPRAATRPPSCRRSATPWPCGGNSPAASPLTSGRWPCLCCPSSCSSPSSR